MHRFLASFDPAVTAKSQTDERIPRRIIHIYSAPNGQPESLPPLARAALTNTQLLHPGYEHILFNRRRMEEFMDAEFPEYRETLKQFPLAIERFDFFRYLAVYRLGGFYFDLDVLLSQPLDPLLTAECVFPFEELTLSGYLRRQCGMDWELANYGFGAVPSSRFLAAVIENCVRGLREPTWRSRALHGIPRYFRGQFEAPYATGPGMVTRTLGENPALHSALTVLFPTDVCDERQWHNFGDFGVHLQQASWRKRDGMFRRWLGRRWESQRRQKLASASRQLGPTRLGNWQSRFSHVA